jgi:CRP-like cAMP-binding protein
VSTLASVGYGDITPKTEGEVCFSIMVMLIGVMVMAFAIGNVVAIINQLDSGRSQYRMQQTAIHEYLRFNGVRSSTLNRLRRFNDYQWRHSRGVRPEVMLNNLPSALRVEITKELLRETLASVPLFTHSQPSLHDRLVMILRPEVYMPRSVILQRGVIGNEIVFITKGVAHLATDAPLEDEEKLLRAGDYIGDLSFFLKEERTCDVVAEGYVEAMVLSRPRFNELVQQEPRLRHVMKELASSQTVRNQTLLLAGVIV